ncbi:unnamed protein product [Brassicogethes aeneus]|uniref:Uncharacterized protein n=1 Tax=Brassicogethes aeneus TaxID=1431903 RepID=A0A9P0AQG7_BRAAE|nr:unnamed protein product [Brassicogethes aeneus]
MADEEDKPAGETPNETPDETTKPEETPEEDDEQPECKKRKPEKIILETDGRKGDEEPKKINCDRGNEDEEEKPPPETSRDFRIYKAMNTKEWGPVCECHGAKDQAVLDLLSITITTIMLMAIGQNIEDSQLRWAANCLENVRDDNGNAPPNIRCILNMIYTKIPKEESPEPEGETTEEAVEEAA